MKTLGLLRLLLSAMPLLRPPPAAAQRLAPALQLRIDNDLLAIRGAGAPPDYDYTHGTYLSYFWGRSGVALAQVIYTPRHNAESPLAADRPYAAWLFGEYAYRTLTSSSITALALRAGVIGPPALGEQMQNGLHRLLGNHLEQGWAHQLPTRLTVAAHAEETKVLLSSSTAAPSRLIAATLGGTLGTMQRNVGGGVRAYVGFGSIHSPTADAPLVARPGRWYVIGAYREDAVFHDAFIEEAPRNADVQAARRLTWVPEAMAGAGWRTSRFAMEYRYTLRGREYEAQPSAHSYGTIAISMIGR